MEDDELVGQVVHRRRKSKKLCFLDVRRGYFYAAATEEAYVELPPKDREPGKDLIGLLEKSLFGARSGARNRQLQPGKDLARLHHT